MSHTTADNSSARTEITPGQGKKSLTTTPKHQRASLSTDSSIGSKIANIVSIVYWKRKEETESTTPVWKEGKKNAIGLAIELERRIKNHGTPVNITIQHGRVKPDPAHQMFLEEPGGPDFDDNKKPEWATEPCDHSWVNIETNPEGDTGEIFFADIAIPKQAALSGGQPGPAILKDHPPGLYEQEKSIPLEEISATEATPWSVTTPAWPKSPPTTGIGTHTDGGSTFTTDTIIQKDIRTVLKELPRESIDTVITSPPYREQRNYTDCSTIWGGHPDCDHAWKEREIYSDTPIREHGGGAFGSDDDPETLSNDRSRQDRYCVKCDAWEGQLGQEVLLEDYIEHLSSIFEQTKQVLKNSGSLFINIGDSYSDGHTYNGSYRDAPRKALCGVPPRLEINLREQGWIVRDRLIWLKPDAREHQTEDRPSPKYEQVLWLVQDQEYKTGPEIPSSNVLEVDTSSNKTEHSAPMPKELPETLLKATTTEDDIVLDTFTGSGTVPAAAAENNRRFLGVEISKPYAEIAEKRVSDYPLKHQEITGQSNLTNFQ
jgi:DNA modification methylase